MSLTIGQKSVRVLKFLRGIRHPRAYGALGAHGFGQADLEEGWALLRRASGTKLDAPKVVPRKSGIYDQLDELENLWFPICRASLERRFPAVAERIFLNLRQTSGVEVSVSMGAFVSRVRELESSKNKDDQQARAVLEERGLTQPVLQQIEALLEQLEVAPPVPDPIHPSAEDISAAEDKMWSWYLEWSVVARQAIHDRRLLRSFGFLTASFTDVPEDEPTPEDGPAESEDLDSPGAVAAE